MQTALQESTESKTIVLFLDDSAAMLALYRAFFQNRGYAILTSSRGARAIQLAEANPVAVAVVDYDMPEMNGHQAAVALKRVRPQLPVIMVSGAIDIPPEALQAVDCFVPKTAGQRRLGEVIESFVRS